LGADARFFRCFIIFPCLYPFKYTLNLPTDNGMGFFQQTLNNKVT